MLLPTLLLTFVACLQDPPAAPATQETAPPAAPAAPAATETPESVRSYLKEAQGQLYDPQAAGLTSLVFDVPIDAPMLGSMGSVHVTWAAGSAAQSEFTPDPAFVVPEQFAAQLSPEVLEAQAVGSAEQFLGIILNKTIASLLDSGVATMAGVEGDLVAVQHTIPAPAGGTPPSMTYYFDSDNRLQKSTAVIEQQGPMGAMQIKMNQSYTWKPAGEGSDKLVAESQSIEADFGVMKQTTSVTFGYQTVAGIVLATDMTTVMKLPSAMGGDQRQVLSAKNLVVNGTPAPGAPTPAAPREPAAGG